MSRRTVFFVSDQTGVTAETMGHSLLTQFGGLDFRPVTLPFVSTVDKAQEAVRKINRAATEDGARPIVFSTLVVDELRDIVLASDGLFLDFFAAFVGPLERELNVRSMHLAGARTACSMSRVTPRASTQPTSPSPTTTVPGRTIRIPT